MTPSQLDEIIGRSNAASQGPWREGIEGNLRIYAKDNCPDAGCIATFMRRKDVRFIAHAREDIPALLAEVRRLREALQVLADIPIEQFDKLAQRPDAHPIMGWNDHTLTIGHVRSARRALTGAA